MLAYKFVQANDRSFSGNEVPWVLDEVREYLGGRVKPCRRGYHSSPTVVEAMNFIYSTTLMVVDVPKRSPTQGSLELMWHRKTASRKMRVVAIRDIQVELRRFAIELARHALDTASLRLAVDGIALDERLFGVLDGAETGLALIYNSVESRRSGNEIGGLLTLANNIVYHVHGLNALSYGADSVAVASRVGDVLRCSLQALDWELLFTITRDPMAARQRGVRAFVANLLQDIVFPGGPPKVVRALNRDREEWYCESYSGRYLRRVPIGDIQSLGNRKDES